MRKRQTKDGLLSARNGYIRHLPWVCAALIVLFTFMMSSQGSADSHTFSRRLASWLVRALRPEMSWLTVGQQQAVIAVMDHALRKAAHIFTYYLLTLFILLGLRGITPNGALIFASGTLIVLLTACADEFHQMFSAGRNASPADVLIDMSGAAAAQITVLLGIPLKKYFSWLSAVWPRNMIVQQKDDGRHQLQVYEGNRPEIEKQTGV